MQGDGSPAPMSASAICSSCRMTTRASTPCSASTRSSTQPIPLKRFARRIASSAPAARRDGLGPGRAVRPHAYLAALGTLLPPPPPGAPGPFALSEPGALSALAGRLRRRARRGRRRRLCLPRRGDSDARPASAGPAVRAASIAGHEAAPSAREAIAPYVRTTARCTPTTLAVRARPQGVGRRPPLRAAGAGPAARRGRRSRHCRCGMPRTGEA